MTRPTITTMKSIMVMVRVINTSQNHHAMGSCFIATVAVNTSQKVHSATIDDGNAARIHRFNVHTVNTVLNVKSTCGVTYFVSTKYHLHSSKPIRHASNSSNRAVELTHSQNWIYLSILFDQCRIFTIKKRTNEIKWNAFVLDCTHIYFLA